MEFTESITIQVPDVEDQVSRFSESEYRQGHGLIVEMAAIHAGLTQNFNMYPEESLEAALTSWVSPYPNPILINHDVTTEPLGRVMAAKMAKEEDGTPFTLLQFAVTDPDAIAKVSDKRYLTGSVGGKAGKAICSICSADWANASLANIPCSHRRGKTYKGQLAYLIMSDISFHEYSFVNVPADKRSYVRSTNADANPEEDGWVRAAKVFALDMNSEEILEFSESQDGKNVLSDMKRKDVTPAYMQIKGAFISALAAEAMENTEEDDKEPQVDKEDDILDVTEKLSEDLAESVEEENEDSTEEAAEEDVLSESPANEDSEEEPEGQEEPEEESPEEEAEAEEEETTEPEESDSDTDLNETVTALESRVEELEAEVQTLTETNEKLRTALKNQLAERVVDAKIARGLGTAESRVEMIEDHVTRSASSLADSLRDLASMPTIVPEERVVPEVDVQSAAIPEEGAPIVNESVEQEPVETTNPEDVFVDVFMGRRTF